MDYTYETKGAQRVAINQLGPALSKRQCTAQVCFRPEPPAPPPPASASDEVKRRYRENLLEQPPPCIIFRGTGKGISQYERDAYGFKIASAERTSAEQLAFSKEEEAPGDALVGKSILYNWPVVGWCVGQVVERNTD